MDVENMQQGLKSTRDAGYGFAYLAAGVIGLHLCLSLLYPRHQWITPVAWGSLNGLALVLSLQQSRAACPHLRWRWQMLAATFALTIAGLLCILTAEYRPGSYHVARWLNDLLRSYRGLPLLMAVCTPEEMEQPENRIFDVLQIVLLAVIFFMLFSPVLFRQPGAISVTSQGLLVNSYSYIQFGIVALVALLAVFTSKTADMRLLYSALAASLCLGAPVSIWTSHILINVWQVVPSSPLFVLNDVYLLAYVAAVPFLRGRVHPKDPPRQLIFLRLSASAFLPLFVVLASMLLTLARDHVRLGILTGLLSLVLYSLRSTCGQFRLLLMRWDLESANERLEALSQHDPLTGLYNRRWFSEAFLHESRLAQRSHLPFSLLLLDIDHFKLFNDTRGHVEGDACLQAVAKLLLDYLGRSTDALARYGGEEFIVMLPDTGADGAKTVANRIVQGLAESKLPHPASPFGIVTVSIGVTTWHGSGPAMAPEAMLQTVDAALYQAKRGGRNRIHFAPSLQEVSIPQEPSRQTESTLAPETSWPSAVPPPAPSL